VAAEERDQLAPPICETLHSLANECQSLLGVTSDAGIMEAVANLISVARRPPSTALSDFLCRRALADIFLRLPVALTGNNFPNWHERVRKAFAESPTLHEAIEELTTLMFPVAPRTPPMAQRILECIEQAHTNPRIRETDVARALHLSRNTVGRLLRAEGTSFRTCLRAFRLRHATSLMRSDLSLKEVASACGYPQPSQLSRDFRREHHCSPSEYREQFRRVTARAQPSFGGNPIPSGE